MSRILIILLAVGTLALSLCCAKKPENIPIVLDTQALKNKTPKEVAAIIGDPISGQDVKDNFLMGFDGPINWRFNVYKTTNVRINRLEVYFTPPARRVFGCWVKFQNPLPESKVTAFAMLNIKTAGEPYVKHDQPGYRISEFTEGDVKSLKTGYEVNADLNRTGLIEAVTIIFHTYTFQN